MIVFMKADVRGIVVIFVVPARVSVARFVVYPSESKFALLAFVTFV